MSEKLWIFASCGRHQGTGVWDTTCIFCVERHEAIKKYILANIQIIVEDSLLAQHHREHCVKKVGTAIATVPLTADELKANQTLQAEYSWDNRLKIDQK